MARNADRYVCQACGAVHTKWSGRCDACEAWNTVVEEAVGTGPGRVLRLDKGRKITLTDLRDGASQEAPRLISGIGELDRVCGGGLVPGSALLIGGDPGIGKSTIVMQLLAALANAGHRAVYISGEEAIAQVRLRARRLGLGDAPVGLAAETGIANILATFEPAGERPSILVVDSIQTMVVDALESAPGTVAQVRAGVQELVRLAKRTGIVVVMVGHVTKEGQIAGPRVVEHMVDTVLYFEGERGHQYRILRAVKNRFGPTDEIGVFEMTDGGLKEVPNPSALFLSEQNDEVAGAAVFAGIEGTRPVLVEVQALVAPSALGTPRRAVVGWDSARLAMVLAVLDARTGLNLGACDVYLNIAGGLRIGEPAADLAVAAALVSSAFDAPLPASTAIFGEISLSGEVRGVSQPDARLKEAAKLGFRRAWIPQGPGGAPVGLELQEIDHLASLVARLRERGEAHREQAREYG